MVSCGLRYRGKGTLRVVQPGVKINGETYLEIVTNTYETDMLRIFRPHEEDGIKNYTFMQDGAGAHTATVVKRYT